MSRRIVSIVALAAVVVLGGLDVGAERMGYPASEFTARRQALAKRLGKGTVVFFGRTEPIPGIRFRQDNDFFYFTGNEDLNAAVVMDAATGNATIYMPRQSAGEIRAMGKNWLETPEVAKERGFTGVQPIENLTSVLARVAGSAEPVLWVRLAAGDDADTNRSEHATNLTRRLTNIGGTRPTEDAFRTATIRQHFPSIEIRDLTRHVDSMRTIKTAREIEILRHNGKICAEAIKRAILATRQNGFEYEIEAEATYWMFRNGVQGNSFPAIVGSGPNVNVWHYQANGRQYKDGDLIVMDYGGALDYMGMDITRTWPVAGKFDEHQLKAYQAALEAEKAIIAAMTVGATRAETREIGRAIYAKHGFQGGAGAGHFVGLSTHDVGDSSLPFQPGMVIAVEPIIEDASRQLHVRIEDTVLITAQGPEILTSGVPKEIDEILALVNKARAANGRTN